MEKVVDSSELNKQPHFPQNESVLGCEQKIAFEDALEDTESDKVSHTAEINEEESHLTTDSEPVNVCERKSEVEDALENDENNSRKYNLKEINENPIVDQYEKETCRKEIEKAASAIKAYDIYAIRSYKCPPLLVKMVIEATCIALRGTSISLDWPSCTKIITHTKTLSLIHSLELLNLPSIRVETIVKHYLNRSDFTLQNIELISGTCSKLYRWINALCSYHRLRFPDQSRQWPINNKNEVCDEPRKSFAPKRTSKQNARSLSRNDIESEVKLALSEVHINDLRELKSYATPPFLVIMTLECVYTLLNGPLSTAGQSWNESRKMLSDCSSFISKLKNYQKHDISSAIMDTVRDRYITNPRFNPQRIVNVSKTCAGLCKWVQALEKYERMSKLGAIAYLKN